MKLTTMSQGSYKMTDQIQDKDSKQMKVTRLTKSMDHPQPVLQVSCHLVNAIKPKMNI